NCRYLLGDMDRLELFRAEHNKVFISTDLAGERVSAYQSLVNKIYGAVNSRRTEHEVFSRLTCAMGRASAHLMEVGHCDVDPTVRELAVEHLTRSFIWLCSFALKVGIDLESAVWRKFPTVCPYCLACHDNASKCSKATKTRIDVWRLRDISNEQAIKRPLT